MENSIKREICILLCHYLKQKKPNIYQQLSDFVEQQKLLPPGCDSVEEALNLRYKSFSPNQFYEFIKSLRPKDDFPSIFRRITPFDTPPVPPDEMAPIKRIYSHRKEIYCLLIDPLSRVIITASDDFAIKIWSTPSLDPIHTFIGHESVVTNISLNPMCSILLSSSEDKTIRLWSLETGKHLAVLGGFTSEIIHYATFSPTGSMIAGACEDGSVPVWTTADALQSKPPIRTFKSPGQGAVGWITFSPGSEFLAFSSEPNSIVVTALKTLNAQILDQHQSNANLIQFSNRYTSITGELSPRLLSVSYEEGTAIIWCIENGKWKAQFIFRPHPDNARRISKINKIGWDCDEHILVIAKTAAVYACDSLTGEIIGQISNTAAAFEDTTCIIGNPVKKWLFFFANRSGACCLVDINQPKIVCEFRVADDADFTEAVWTKDGEYVYAADLAGAITAFKLCESKSGIQMQLYECFLNEEFGVSSDEIFYCNRRGEKLNPQPLSHDIRTFNIPLRIAQSPIIRNSAIELRIIQKMVSTDHPTAASPQAAPIGPPPLHIRITDEFPVNPKGQLMFKVGTDSDVEEEEATEFKIESDNENWNFISESSFEKEDSDDSTDVPKSLDVQNYVLSKDVPPGYNSPWSYIVSYDIDYYIPQYGDSIIVIRELYQKMLKETNLQALDSIDPLFADQNHSQTFYDIQRANIRMVEPSDTGMILTILSQNSLSFRIVYPFPCNIDFIIPMSRFKAGYGMLSLIKIGTQLTFQRKDSDGDLISIYGTVTRLKENMQSYNSIVVDVNGTQIAISPWEILTIGMRDARTQIRHDSSKFQMIIPTLLQSLDVLMNDPRLACLKHCVDPSQVQRVSPMPISTTMIQERLNNHYYRTLNGIIFDIKLVLKNMKTSFPEDSNEVNAATIFERSMKQAIETLATTTFIEQKQKKGM